MLGSLASIYGIIYLYISDDWRCRLWSVITAAGVSFIAYKICKYNARRLNVEIRMLAQRKAALEKEVLGSKRKSSGYDPDKHF